MVEKSLPGNIEEIVRKIELERPDVGSAARQISRRILGEIIIPNNSFGNEQAIKWVRLGIQESNVINMIHVSVNALGLPPHEYDQDSGVVMGKKEETTLKELARVASLQLSEVANKWEIPSRRLVADAVLALTDSLNSLEETI